MGLEGGADDYLVKPFDRNEVVKRIQALLDRKRKPAPTDRVNRSVSRLPRTDRR